MQVISIDEKDVNFYKIWLGHIVQSLELIGNQKIKVVSFLLENMDYENKICMTLRQMSVKSKISIDTISKTVNALKKANFIKAINVGAYQINPDTIFKGSKNKRLNVLYQYQQIKVDTENEDNSGSKIE